MNPNPYVVLGCLSNMHIEHLQANCVTKIPCPPYPLQGKFFMILLCMLHPSSTLYLCLWGVN